MTAWLPVAPLALAAFPLLAVSMVLLWAPRWAPVAVNWWTAPFALAMVAGVAGNVLDWRGAAMLLLFAAACRAARIASGSAARVAAHASMFGVAAALMAHVLPGFDNPRVLDGVRLAPDSLPYSKYLNLDKGVAGLFLLGLYTPTLTARPSRAGAAGWLGRFAVMSGVVIAATVALGYARWDPKLPAWWLPWLVSMIFLTALPEEALFRGVIQERLHQRFGESPLGRWGAAALAGLLFGVAHAGGGWSYVLLASVAGIGYGWIYAAAGTIGASILAHTGLNLLHLLFFSYPALE